MGDIPSNTPTSLSSHRRGFRICRSRMVAGDGRAGIRTSIGAICAEARRFRPWLNARMGVEPHGRRKRSRTAVDAAMEGGMS